MGCQNISFPANTVFLVTGGAGFIGSNLCEAILKLGCRVRCLDDLSTGKQANVDLFAGNPEYEFIRGDVKDFDICMRACEGVDYVLHQAAWGSVPRSLEMPLFYCANNVSGTLNMLEAAHRRKVKKFIYASSSSVYGDTHTFPQKEGSEGNPLSPYAVSKCANEDWARQYAMHYDLETIGLRYFNVFGRRQDPEGAYAAVIPKFIRQLLRDERPTIHGDGLQSRDFTYVENVIEANLKACLAGKNASGQVCNIAFGESNTLLDVYHTIANALDVNTEPVFGPARPGDIRHSYADITRAKELLGYDPDWSFERGIRAAIDWYRDNLC